MYRRLASIVLAVAALLGGGLARPPQARAAEACFPETGFCIQGRFLDYWTANGGLAINGFPLSDERRELLENGNEYTVQYFERARLEYHPEHTPPYDVLLGQFGRRALADSLETDRPFGGFAGTVAPAAPQPGSVYFSATGHNLGGAFLAYWQANGGVAQFGLPLTEEGRETLTPPDPTTGAATPLTVQYFERARLEYHPENAGTPYEVLLGQFGRAILGQNALLSGGLGRLYLTNPTVQQRLGAPTGPVAQGPGVIQEFERGRMIWRGDRRQIYVLCGDRQAGQVLVDFAARTVYYPDTWAEGQEPGGGAAPQAGLYLPKRGFGKVWREHLFIQQCLGYALTPDETAYTLLAQEFGAGEVMLSAPDDGIYVVEAQYFSAGPKADYERFADPSR